MIKRFAFHTVWVVIVLLLIAYSINYKSGNEAMVAQVESQVTAISYQKPVLVKNIYVSPGQVVDSGDLLLEVDRPDLELNLEKSTTEKSQLETRILEVNSNFQNSLMLLETKYEIRNSDLVHEADELKFELNASANRKTKMDSASLFSFNSSNEIALNRLDLVRKQLVSLEKEYELERSQVKNSFNNTSFQLTSHLAIVEKEIQEIILEKEQLQRRAEKPCTIGNLFVQLNEIVPPYTTLLSVYDINPTLIKAFIQERGVKEIKIGSKVMVESINRDYRIEGQIIEIGSRITAYPEKINPLMSQKSYGQEIFINIPDSNDFLNGEKVYVYIVEDEI